MPQAPRYWSAAFVDALVDRLNTDVDFRRIARRFSDTIELQCLDTPDGLDVRVAYVVDSGTVSARVLEDEAPSERIRNDSLDPRKAMARATAPYGVWCRLDDGSMTIAAAMALPEYRLEGPRLKIMMNLPVFDAIGRVAAATPKRY